MASLVRETLPRLPELIGEVAERGKREVEQNQETMRHQFDVVRNVGQALVRQVRRRPVSADRSTGEPAVRPSPVTESRPAPAAEAGAAGHDGESTIRAAQSMVG